MACTRRGTGGHITAGTCGPCHVQEKHPSTRVGGVAAIGSNPVWPTRTCHGSSGQRCAGACSAGLWHDARHLWSQGRLAGTKRRCCTAGPASQWRIPRTVNCAPFEQPASLMQGLGPSPPMAGPLEKHFNHEWHCRLRTWPMRSQGILATLATIRAPTMSNAPPTAYGGMLAAGIASKTLANCRPFWMLVEARLVCLRHQGARRPPRAAGCRLLPGRRHECLHSRHTPELATQASCSLLDTTSSGDWRCGECPVERKGQAEAASCWQKNVGGARRLIKFLICLELPSGLTQHRHSAHRHWHEEEMDWQKAHRERARRTG